MQNPSTQSVMRRRLSPGLAGAIAGLCWIGTSLSVLGQIPIYSLPNVTVTTLGGGPIVQCGSFAGTNDGNTLQDSQFNEPSSAALDSLGNLYIADTKNNEVRVVTEAGNTANSETSSWVLDFIGANGTNRVTNNAAAGVIAVAEDAGDDLYVLTTNNLTKWNQYFNLLEVVSFTTNTPNETPPVATAITISRDSSTNIFVAFTNGVIIRFNLLNTAFPAVGSAIGVSTTEGGTSVFGYPVVSTVFANNFTNFNWKPAGLALMTNGMLAVSDTVSNAIYMVNTNGISGGGGAKGGKGANGNSAPLKYTGGNLNGTTNTAGYADGLPSYAQFNQPRGLSASSDGQLVVADTMNNAVRLIDTNAITTTLYGTSTNSWESSSCCSCDPAVYPGWLDGTVGNSFIGAESRQPVSVTIASNGIVFVTELYYDLLREATGTGLNPVFFTNAPALQPPSVAITSPTNNTVLSAPTNLPVTVVATDPNSNGVVQSVTLYDTTNGTTYSIQNQTVVSNNQLSFLWISTPLGSNTLTAVALDNFGQTATSAPVTVIVGGTVTSTALAPPVIAPNFGYFPFCETIEITETASNQPIQIFYTTDGTTPTTNSLQVSNLTTNNGVLSGSIQWCDSLHDLSSLQIVAFNGVAFSTVTSGQAAPTNEIGFVRGATGGAGDTLVLPIVVDLQSNGVLESVQFRVEIAPTNGNTNVISPLTLLRLTTNDFIPLAGPGTDNTPVSYETISYMTNYAQGTSNVQGLLVSAAGSGSGLFVSGFAAVCLLEVQIPANCVNGQQYQLSVLVPSGTSDAQQTPVNMTPMTNQLLTVATVQYFSGDSSPGNGYNAGEFGNGFLNSADVNNALYASVGIRVPYPFSDAYNAMDAYPETATEIGDNFITYLDWQTILLRSEGLDTNNWVRFWADGVRMHTNVTWIAGGTNSVPIGVTTNLVPAALAENHTPARPKQATNSPPGLVWFCPALIGAGTMTNLAPGNSYSIPIYEKTVPGYGLAGFQFRATLTANGGAPAPGAIAFTVAPGIPDSSQLAGLSPNDVVCAWNLGAFSSPLVGSNLLGWISFQAPAAGQAGQSYSLHFSAVEGAADLNTPYQMESVPATAWVLTSAQQPAQITSDEWRTNFFGSYTNALAADNADPDGDGSLNWQEYVAGTNPTNARSRLQFSAITAGTNQTSGSTLGWLTAPGKTYLLQSSPTPGGANWSVINTSTGDGNVFEFLLPNSGGKANFYRICVQP
jgi:hypothetical protein